MRKFALVLAAAGMFGFGGSTFATEHEPEPKGAAIGFYVCGGSFESVGAAWKAGGVSNGTTPKEIAEREGWTTPAEVLHENCANPDSIGEGPLPD